MAESTISEVPRHRHLVAVAHRRKAGIRECAVSDDRAVSRAVHPPRDRLSRVTAQASTPEDDLADRVVWRVAGIRDALPDGGPVRSGVALRSVVEYVVGVPRGGRRELRIGRN